MRLSASCTGTEELGGPWRIIQYLCTHHVLRVFISPSGFFFFFMLRAIKHWEVLRKEVVGALSMETFKVRVDGALSTRGSCGCPSWQGSGASCPLRAPFNSNHSIIHDPMTQHFLY